MTNKSQQINASILVLSIAGILFGSLFIGLLLWGIPAYRVYSAEQDGRAILARAEYSRQAQVADARSKAESAEYLKKAAETIESSLSPQYLRYLAIQMQEEVGRDNGRAVYFVQGDERPVIPAQ